MSAIEALKKLQDNYSRYNKKVLLRGLSDDCLMRLENAEANMEVSDKAEGQSKLEKEN